MKTINFYSNGNSNNHGCEAIYLSLMEILGNNKYVAYSENYDEDKKVLNDKLNLVNISQEYNYSILENLIYKVSYKLKKDDMLFYKYKYKGFKKNFNTRNEIFLSVGGDNYCYGCSEWLKVLNDIVKKNNKIILTGCSLEPNSFDENMKNNLSIFDHIIARESITYEALESNGFSNISLIPDPAFVLPKCEIDDANDLSFFQKETIGINISPLILKDDSNGIIKKNIDLLLEYIIKETNYNIALVPHVMIKGNNDLEAMKIYFEKYQNTGRIRIIKKDSACAIKGYISKCKIFVAARTHVSIAAYSTCVPTLVLGYSVKSRGIAKDIFGSYENYVLPINQINEETDVQKSFMYILNNYSKIKFILENTIPSYKEKCYQIKQIIEEFE